MKAIVLALIATSLVGCASMQQQAVPAPDVTINAPAAKVRDEIVIRLVSKGATVSSIGDSMVVVEKELSGMNATFAQLALGNAYSTTPKATVQFVLLPQGSTSVRVLGSAKVSTQMPGGQHSSTEATGSYADLTRFLNDVKTQMELSK